MKQVDVQVTDRFLLRRVERTGGDLGLRAGYGKSDGYGIAVRKSGGIPGQRAARTVQREQRDYQIIKGCFHREVGIKGRSEGHCPGSI